MLRRRLRSILGLHLLDASGAAPPPDMCRPAAPRHHHVSLRGAETPWLRAAALSDCPSDKAFRTPHGLEYKYTFFIQHTESHSLIITSVSAYHSVSREMKIKQCLNQKILECYPWGARARSELVFIYRCP